MSCFGVAFLAGDCTGFLGLAAPELLAVFLAPSGVGDAGVCVVDVVTCATFTALESTVVLVSAAA